MAAIAYHVSAGTTPELLSRLRVTFLISIFFLEKCTFSTTSDLFRMDLWPDLNFVIYTAFHRSVGPMVFYIFRLSVFVPYKWPLDCYVSLRSWCNGWYLTCAEECACGICSANFNCTHEVIWVWIIITNVMQVLELNCPYGDCLACSQNNDLGHGGVTLGVDLHEVLCLVYLNFWMPLLHATFECNTCKPSEVLNIETASMAARFRVFIQRVFGQKEHWRSWRWIRILSSPMRIVNPTAL